LTFHNPKYIFCNFTLSWSISAFLLSDLMMLSTSIRHEILATPFCWCSNVSSRRRGSSWARAHPLTSWRSLLGMKQ
jgi:hypothetical protein